MTNDGRDNFAADIVSLFAAAFTDRTRYFVEGRNMTQIRVLYTKLDVWVPLDQRGEAWIEGEVLRLR